MNPQLRLLQCDEWSDSLWSPNQIVARVGWSENDDREPTFNGSLLLFDLSRFAKHPWAPGTNVRPVLTWTEYDPDTNDSIQMAATSEPVYLGNTTPAILWTCLVFAIIMILLWGLSGGQKSVANPFKAWGQYIQTADKHYSLSLTQMALWTLAVGSLVLHFGIIRLKVPEIPDTLVMLMGLSAGTSLVSHWQVKRDRSTNPDPQPSNGWRDLVNMVLLDGGIFPALARGQMLLWTLVAVGLFMYKAIMEGVLWEVSPELVALMGVSQGTFLAQKGLGLGEAKERQQAKEKAEADEKKRKEQAEIKRLAEEAARSAEETGEDE